jgi:ADP-heptose:LPS heptosyltransferase
MVASFLRLLRKVIIRTPADDRCVLVFATTAIGDSIMMSSCIRLLGEAGFNIYLVAGKAAVTVLGDHEAIKKTFHYRRGWFRALPMVWPIWKANCSRALVLHVSDSAAWMLASVGAELRSFCGTSLRHQKPNFDVSWIDDSAAPHIAEKYCLVAISALGINIPYTLRNEIFNRNFRNRSCHKSNPKRSAIGLVPGAQNFYKCWPVKNFLQLGIELENRGFEIFIFGTQHESDRISVLSTGLPRAKVFSGSLEDVCVALQRLDCIISGDTGLMHIADAVGCPVVGLFSATPSFLARPLNTKRSRVIHKPVTCFPSTTFRITETTCYNKSCGNPICMKQISVDEVLGKVIDLCG